MKAVGRLRTGIFARVRPRFISTAKCSTRGSISTISRFAVRASRQSRSAHFNYAAEVAIAIGSTIEGSSFSGLLTRVEIGHIRIGSAGNGLIRSPGSGSSLSQRV